MKSPTPPTTLAPTTLAPTVLTEGLYAVVAAYGGNICAGLVMDLYNGFEFTQNNSSLIGYTGTVPISNRIRILPDVSNCASQCQLQTDCGYFGYSLQPNTGGYAFCFLYITGTPGDCTVIPNMIERPPPQVTIYALSHACRSKRACDG